MNKHLISGVCILLALTGSYLKAQVKIGNNPNSINANSILELESPNKGFLPPRVSLSSVSSPSPLSAPVPTGMIVYSSGGTISDGAYMWSGSKWQNFSTDIATRSNFVLVRSASDLPAPVGGVITLSAGTLYEINGTITLSNKIDLNGCQVTGRDPVNDKMVYTGSGELFTGSNVGNLRYLTFMASSGKVFNINAGGANKNLLVQNCYFLGCSNVGTIQAVGGTVYFANVAYFSNSNGITYQNNTYVVLDNTLWDISNYNTYESFVGSFSIIQILGGDRLVSSANSATALSVSGITSLGAGSVKVVMFVGNGTYVSGAFSGSWEVESAGLNTEKDDVSAGNIYLTSAISTSFTSVSTATKILGTTAAASMFRVSSPASNRLSYTGTKAKRFQVICSLSSIASGNNKNFSFYIVKNGTILPESKQLMKCSSSVDRGSITLSCTVQLSTNDYIEVWVENDTDNTSVLIESLNLAIK